MANGIVNIGLRLTATAKENPDAPGVIVHPGSGNPADAQRISFRDLDLDSNAIASGLRARGIRPGMRLVLLVPQGIDFISLVFALFKVGAVGVLVDPGMGMKRMIACLEEVKADGFVAIPIGQAVRTVLRRRFKTAIHNVTVGRRWFWGGATLKELREARKKTGSNAAADFEPANTQAEDPAAIIFTSGATGIPKGVHYRHGNFDQQVEQIRDRYGIEPGGIDVAAFPLFSLFNAGMGTTTVLPDMDPTRPAKVDPTRFVAAVNDFSAGQSFASPAVWNAVGRYCERESVRMPTLHRVLSAGAPVPPHVLQRVKAAIAEDGDVHTPYGATEALPVASISATEVLGETADKSATGAGTCVGKKFSGIDWKIIRTTDDPIGDIGDVQPVADGEIGELIVRGPVVTREYITRVEANAFSKIADSDAVWHRMGDLGYFDEQQRFWFCGRKAHRVTTADRVMYPVPCEAIFNTHERVFRTAVVGVGSPGNQEPVAIVEIWPEQQAKSPDDARALVKQLQQLAQEHSLTKPIKKVLLHRSLPVDVRHNSKINRELLREWAAKKGERDEG